MLKDFADFLGGPSALLIPAWGCLQRNLEELPKDLPKKLRRIQFKQEVAKYIPGGSKLYVEILAKEVESRIQLLEATASPAASGKQAEKNITKAITAMFNWWNVHRYVVAGTPAEPFNLDNVHCSQVAVLKNWCNKNVHNSVERSKMVTKILSANKVLSASQADKILVTLFLK